MQARVRSTKLSKMWIDGKCFELRPIKLRPEAKKDFAVNYDIQMNDNGQVFTTFLVPKIYCKRLKDYPHFKLKFLEIETKTTVRIQEGRFMISGQSEESVSEARTQIQSVIGAIRDRNPAAQFISIRLSRESILTNFNKFKEDVLNMENIDGMDESLFIRAPRLHLTIIVFALMDKSEKDEAISALEAYKKTILDPLIQKTGQLRIKVSGVACMQNNLKKAHVLYANAQFVDENQITLQQFANDIAEFFYNRGLVVRTCEENVKIHMTLINTKYRKSVGESPKRKWVKRQTYDATEIVDKYNDFYFGECNLDAINISIMGTSDPDGFYGTLVTIAVN